MDFDYLTYFKESNNFTYPDWDALENSIPKELDDAQLDNLWNDIFRSWSEKLAIELGKEYQIIDTNNFKIITKQNDAFIQSYSSFLERSLSTILTRLPHIAYKYENEPLLVLIIEDLDDYYRYISHFYEEGEFGLSGGLFYKKGVGHFIFPHLDQFSSELVSAHELTHALLNHLNLPAWLDEGIATNMEDCITLSNPLNTSQEIRSKHARFWDEEKMQEFWSGKSFSRTDEGQELSYNLAQFLIKQLSRNYNAFSNFCNDANYEDSGEAASMEHFAISLGELITPLLGDKDWKPKPELWEPTNSLEL